jgi:hypothetical protein
MIPRLPSREFSFVKLSLALQAITVLVDDDVTWPSTIVVPVGYTGPTNHGQATTDKVWGTRSRTILSN